MLQKTGKQWCTCKNPGIPNIDRGNWRGECDSLFHCVLALREECCVLRRITPYTFISPTRMTSAVNKFWSRRPHWESRRQPTFWVRRCEFPRGVWGHALRKFWNLDAWKCYFQHSPDGIWALRTIKIMLYTPYAMFTTTVLFLEISITGF